MMKWNDVVINQFGGVVKGAAVTVKHAGLQTSPTIYSDNGTSTVASSTVTADSLGRYSFYVADGRYDLNISGAGITAYTESDILLFDPAASTGAAGVGFLSSGTRPTAGSMAAAVNDLCLNVKNAPFNAAGNGTTDDTTAITTAIAAAVTAGGGIVFFPAGTYKFTSKITVTASVMLMGAGKHVSELLHGFSGDAMELGSQASLRDLYIEGQGGTYSGKGVVMSVAGAGKQRIHNCKIINFASACIAFDDKDAGSQFSGFDIETYQVSGATGTGNYAITIVDTAQTSAIPRKFTQIETAGNCAFSFGGSNGTYIASSFLGDLAYSTNSKDVQLVGTRVANQSTLTVTGANNGFVGCDVAPSLTFSGTGPHAFQGSTCNGTITDSTSASNNVISAPSVTYTPTWTGASANPVIGNGTLRGEYTRNGDTITLAIEMIAGSGTTFGTGAFQFSVPVTPAPTSGATQTGTAYLLDSGTTTSSARAVLASGGTFLTLASDATLTAVGTASPWTWASGDIIRINITYQL